MWITFCQDEKTGLNYIFLKKQTWAFKNNLILLYCDVMEKSIKLKKAKRGRKHGFLKRSKTNSGKKVLKRRRLAGRKKLSI